MPTPLRGQLASAAVVVQVVDALRFLPASQAAGDVVMTINRPVVTLANLSRLNFMYTCARQYSREPGGTVLDPQVDFAFAPADRVF